MSLQQDIETQMKEAMKAKDADRLSTLRMLRSSFKNVQIDKGLSELSDEVAQEVIAKEVKKLKDSIADFEKAGRDDLAAKTKAEVEVLAAFLPEQMSDPEIMAVVSAKAEALGVTDPSGAGRLTGEVMKELKGKADGGAVNRLIREHLQNGS